jgi:hypothetical protein
MPLCTILTKCPAPFGARILRLARRFIRAQRAWRERCQYRVEGSNDLAIAAQHEAVAVLEPPDAAARADVDETYAACIELARAPDRLAEVRVAAVEQDVAGL